VEATLAPTPTTAIAAQASHPGRLRTARPRPAFQMSLSERLLVARLVKRDEEAFNEVVRQHGDRVFNLVLRMVGSRAEAEDIAQEVFVTVFKSIDRSAAKPSCPPGYCALPPTTPRIASSTWPAAGSRVLSRTEMTAPIWPTKEEPRPSRTSTARRLA